MICTDLPSVIICIIAAIAGWSFTRLLWNEFITLKRHDATQPHKDAPLADWKYWVRTSLAIRDRSVQYLGTCIIACFVGVVFYAIMAAIN